jgi:hypothetical protein
MVACRVHSFWIAVLIMFTFTSVEPIKSQNEVILSVPNKYIPRYASSYVSGKNAAEILWEAILGFIGEL